MTRSRVFRSQNKFKQDFGDIYNQPDPRRYFGALEPLQYMIPQHSKPVFETVIAALRSTRGLDTVTVLDLGCSYGINAALLKYGLSMSGLYSHYGALGSRDISREESLERDAAMLKQQSKNSHLRFIGVDVAPEAVAYATEAGLLDVGVVANLETGPPSPEAAAKMATADLVISSGCVGYVTEQTFTRILDTIESETQPWVASFVLRMFPYDAISKALAERGFVNEKLAGHIFVQRSFASECEQAHVIEQLAQMKINPAGREAEGCYHAEFYLSRPQHEAARAPLETIIADASLPCRSRQVGDTLPMQAQLPGADRAQSPQRDDD